jgi:hypothetical protein
MRNNNNNSNNPRKTNTDFEDMLERHNAIKQKRLKNLQNRKSYKDYPLEEEDSYDYDE